MKRRNFLGLPLAAALLPISKMVEAEAKTDEMKLPEGLDRKEIHELGRKAPYFEDMDKFISNPVHRFVHYPVEIRESIKLTPQNNGENVKSSSISIRTKYFRDARWDVLGRAIQILEQNTKCKIDSVVVSRAIDEIADKADPKWRTDSDFNKRMWRRITSIHKRFKDMPYVCFYLSREGKFHIYGYENRLKPQQPKISDNHYVANMG
jgi:hypothetical protein